MAKPKWLTDGIPGDKIIRHRGKLYKLATVRDAKSFGRLSETRRAAQKWASSGGGGVVFKLHNTYMFAVYLPYSGTEHPEDRSRYHERR